MYLNEKAWKTEQADPYIIGNAMKDFLEVYGELDVRFRAGQIYVLKDFDMELASYSVKKWLNTIDRDDRRRFLSFWNKRIEYNPDDECEFQYHEQAMLGALEAIINDNFVISLGLSEEWKQEVLEGTFYSLKTDTQDTVQILNVCNREQLARESILAVLERCRSIEIYTYEELWNRRKEFFPHLEFCPSVEKDLLGLERSYIRQIIKKFVELDDYCAKYAGLPFDPRNLSRTTPETDATLEKYQKEHTFTDMDGNSHLASWHMRFTGIPGRIFMIPDYDTDKILICYVGKKLPNVSYPT